MIPLYYDFHIHSCLSPCGDDDMTPSNIVGMAFVKGLQAIAITDHNCCKNCAAAMALGEDCHITVIPGMELTTCEEVHVICLFSALSDALAFDSYVYTHLLPIKNKESIFGKQQIMDANDQVTGTVDKLLISATDISFDEVVSLVSLYHGIAYPAHLDKTTTSLISNLGFIPPDSSFCCAELRDLNNLHTLKKANPYLESCHIISSSDAHYLADINEPHYQVFAASASAEDIITALCKKHQS